MSNNPVADVARLATREVSRVVSFGLVPALSILTLLVIVPSVAREFGEPGIVAISLGQTIGAIMSIVVSLSWPLTGPAAAARATASERVSLYALSVGTRSTVFCVAAPLGALLPVVLLREQVLSGALCAVAFTALGFSNSWYYAGIGQARGLLVYEAIPRMVATACAAVALRLGAPLAIYPLMLLVATTVGLVLINRQATGRATWSVHRSSIEHLAGEFRVTAARLASSLCQYGTTPVLTFLIPYQVFTFIIYDRIQQSALNAAMSFTSAQLNRVAAQYPPNRRVQTAVLFVDGVFAVGVGCALYAILPSALQLLYGEIGVFNSRYGLLISVAFALTLAHKCVIAHGLLPLRDDLWAANIVGYTSIFGLLTVAGLALQGGVEGALWGLTISNAATAVVVVVRYLVVNRQVHGTGGLQ